MVTWCCPAATNSTRTLLFGQRERGQPDCGKAHRLACRRTRLSACSRRPPCRHGVAAVPDAWGAGDNAAITDLSVDTPGARTVPNAQHAVRQGKRLAANLVAALRGEATRNYIHKSIGMVATLGIGRGVFQSGRIVITGFPAWLMHRGYHVLAVPTWERKTRVFAVWMTALLFGRDIVFLESTQHPRAAFVTGGDPDARLLVFLFTRCEYPELHVFSRPSATDRLNRIRIELLKSGSPGPATGIAKQFGAGCHMCSYSLGRVKQERPFGEFDQALDRK